MREDAAPKGAKPFNLELALKGHPCVLGTAINTTKVGNVFLNDSNGRYPVQVVIREEDGDYEIYTFSKEGYSSYGEPDIEVDIFLEDVEWVEPYKPGELLFYTDENGVDLDVVYVGKLEDTHILLLDGFNSNKHTQSLRLTDQELKHGVRRAVSAPEKAENIWNSSEFQSELKALVEKYSQK